MNVKRLSVPIFVVFVLFTSVLAVGAVDCTCGDICVNTTGWWHAGGTFNASETPIQAAVDNAVEGDTVCVKEGSYTENVNVDKRLTIRSENGSDSTIVDAADSSVDVFHVGVGYVNISGFTVKGATGVVTGEKCAGISLIYAEHCNISGNNASENRYGISLFSSNKTTPLQTIKFQRTAILASLSLVLAATPLQTTMPATLMGPALVSPRILAVISLQVITPATTLEVVGSPSPTRATTL